MNQVIVILIISINEFYTFKMSFSIYINFIFILNVMEKIYISISLLTSELFYSSAKTFVIDHSINDDKYLIHSCLKGPESGVYYCGEGAIIKNNSVIINLPSYVDKLATDLSANVTPIWNNKHGSRIYKYLK
jgi:hypothetical protein